MATQKEIPTTVAFDKYTLHYEKETHLAYP